MVRIRFQREGKPARRITGWWRVDRAAKRDRPPSGVLGFYNPRLEKDKLSVNEARVKYWHDMGALPSETVKIYSSNRRLEADHRLIQSPKHEFSSGLDTTLRCPGR